MRSGTEKKSIVDNIEYSKQLNYIGQDILLSEARIPQLTRSIILLSFFAISGFMIWSSLSTVNEVVRTQGQLTPYQHVHVVKNLKGVTIDTVAVSEGQLVREGDILYTLTDDNIKKERKRIISKLYTLKLQREHLQSIAKKRPPEYEVITQDLIQKYKLSNMSYIPSKSPSSIVNTINDQKEVIELRLNTKIEESQTYNSIIKNALHNYQLAKEALRLRKQLIRNDINPKITIAQSEDELNRYLFEYKQVKRLKSEIDDDIVALKDKLKNLDTNKKVSISKRIAQLNLLIKENEKVMSSIEEEINSLSVRSPVDGIARRIDQDIIGINIDAGKKVMEIVPTVGDFNAIIKINPQDIGRVQIGMPVDIKVTSYQYDRYGSIMGRIESISPSTYYTTSGEAYYRAIVKLSKKYVGDDKTKNIILPGMNVQADILTSKKSILAYLIRPLKVSFNYAVTQR